MTARHLIADTDLSLLCNVDVNNLVYTGSKLIGVGAVVNLYVNNESNLRLRRMPSGIILAFNGASRVAQHLFLHDEWFELGEGEAFDKRFIVTKIIPRFYGSTRDMDFWKRREERFTNEIGAGFIIAKDSDVYIVFSDLSVIKCDKMAAMSDEDADVIMLSYASACREADPEVVIKKTYEFTASKNAKISSHGYIINTKDFTLKRMEDVK